MQACTRWRLVVGSDNVGYDYKEIILRDLESDPRVAHVVDVGVSRGENTPYSEVGIRAAQKVAEGVADRAILICGTGIGMSISANKVPGVRAATVHDSYSCERSVLSNNCQILALGERVIGVEVARRLVREWLGYVFDPTSPSQVKVAVIERYEHTSREDRASS